MIKRLASVAAAVSLAAGVTLLGPASQATAGTSWESKVAGATGQSAGTSWELRSGTSWE